MPRLPRLGEIREEDKIILAHVRVKSTHFEERYLQYFEVESDNGQIVKIRVDASSVETMEWIKAHANSYLDITIFPYYWSMGDRRGVANYFQRAQVS